MSITKEEVQNKVGSNPRWATRALLAIYEFQTAEEQDLGATVEHNKVGFSGADADILTSFAEQVKSGRTLSRKQMAVLFKRMPKYWRQLINIAESKENSNG